MEVEDLSARDETASVLEPPRIDTPAMRWEVMFYFAILNIVMGLGSPLGIAAIPITYFLKDTLHMSPVRLAIFLALVSIPVCAGFLFGFIRDRWRSAKWGDQQYLFVCALIAAACYFWLTTSAIDYYKLLSIVLIIVAVYVMIYTSAQALMAGVARAYGMTGRLSVAFSFGYFVPLVISALAGGWLVAHVSVRGTFLIAAGVTIVIAIQVLLATRRRNRIRKLARVR